MTFFKNKRIQIFLVIYTLLIFISGLFIGKTLTYNGFKYKGWRRHHRYSIHNQVKSFTNKLDLTTKQAKQLEAIITKHRASIKEIRSSIRKDFKAVRDQRIKDINAILTTEQQTKFKKFLEKHRKKRNKRFK